MYLKSSAGFQSQSPKYVAKSLCQDEEILTNPKEVSLRFTNDQVLALASSSNRSHVLNNELLDELLVLGQWTYLITIEHLRTD
jgi:hypothetical protein